MSKNLIDQNCKVNTADLLEQLDAMRNTLDAIEQKVEPTPASVPDTFKMATFYASPFNRLADQVTREAEAFDDFLSGLWSNICCAAKSPVATKNLEMWERSVEHLSHAWYQQVATLRNNVAAVRDFAKYMIMATAIACECDYDTLKNAVEQGACHE